MMWWMFCYWKYDYGCFVQKVYISNWSIFFINSVLSNSSSFLASAILAFANSMLGRSVSNTTHPDHCRTTTRAPCAIAGGYCMINGVRRCFHKDIAPRLVAFGCRWGCRWAPRKDWRQTLEAQNARAQRRRAERQHLRNHHPCRIAAEPGSIGASPRAPPPWTGGYMSWLDRWALQAQQQGGGQQQQQPQPGLGGGLGARM